MGWIKSSLILSQREKQPAEKKTVYRAATDAIHPMTERERWTNLRKGKEWSYDQRLQGTGVGYARGRY